jgi:SET domain-containing protein
LDEWESNKINPTILNCYVFEWNNHEKSAIALGYGSLFNHSSKKNVTYKNNYRDKTIDFVATRNIKKGQQLFINYGYNVKDALQITLNNKQKWKANE